jgi:putative PIN family toxin of toxin-antitoxin system
MIRVVLDTNILISALLNPRGAPAEVFLSVLLEPDAQLCVSGEIYAEYEEMIRRPRLHRSDSEIEDTLRSIRENGFWVRPTEKLHACSDPGDNIFLECAQAAGAHFLVTGNAKHFPSSWHVTQIVTARRYLDVPCESNRPIPADLDIRDTHQANCHH